MLTSERWFVAVCAVAAWSLAPALGWPEGVAAPERGQEVVQRHVGGRLDRPVAVARHVTPHAGMPLRTAARRCPEATFLPSDPSAYEEASRRVMEKAGLVYERDVVHTVEKPSASATRRISS